MLPPPGLRIVFSSSSFFTSRPSSHTVLYTHKSLLSYTSRTLYQPSSSAKSICPTTPSSTRAVPARQRAALVVTITRLPRTLLTTQTTALLLIVPANTKPVCDPFAVNLIICIAALTKLQTTSLPLSPTQETTPSSIMGSVPASTAAPLATLRAPHRTPPAQVAATTVAATTENDADMMN